MCRAESSPVSLKNLHQCRYETNALVHIPHTASLQCTVWPGALVYIHFTLLAYTPVQIRCHITHTCPTEPLISLHINPTLLHIQVTNNKLHLVITRLLVYMCQQKYTPKCHISHICQLLHEHKRDICVSISVSYELNAINNMITSTGVHFTLLPYKPE